MPLHLALAATLGFLTFLSTLMLGLGQSDSFLPILIGAAAVTSFILTDYRKIIQLGDWIVNALAIAIVCTNVVDVLHHRGEELAWSIARVLVFVQVVLLFREKDTRFCWQILLISLLQVVVATVFHQSIFFGMLLILYVFVGLCAFIFLFLQQEHRYYRQHSFIKTFSESIKAEMTERQDRGRLVRLALLALLMGPILLVMSFGKKKNGQTTSQKLTAKNALRSFFLIFPTEEDIAQKKHWERVEDVQGKEKAFFHAVPQHVAKHKGDVDSSFTFCRFPLLMECPSFSAGTQNPHPWSGSWRELFIHMTTGTFFAFFLAIAIFCLIPRVGRIEFDNFTLKQEFEGWLRPVQQYISVGTVGVNDEIQLGSLGSVIVHHQEVIDVRFFHHPDNQLITDTEHSEHLYQEILGATLYFRGIPLDTYSDGTWTQSPVTNPVGWYRLADVSDFDTTRIGAPLPPQDLQYIHFADGCDLVTLAMSMQPLDTLVFFAPHPFFSIDKSDEIDLRRTNSRIEEVRQRRRERNKTIVSTAFQQGIQIDLVPCQEKINRNNIMQIPDEGLTSLKTLAAKWDAESKLPASDIVGRARFMEQKFLQSPEFSYQLGGTIRDYDLDPLEDFIALNPKGHCEYFAGALALMLRSVDIGSRVIIGFKAEVTDYDASCSIRQSDAHSWVEVYIPPETMQFQTADKYAYWWENGGWLRLDPTPAPVNSAIVTALTLQWADWSHRVQHLWEEYVLNMTPVKQSLVIYQPLYQAGKYVFHRVFNREFWRLFWSDMVLYYRSFFTDIPQPKRQMGDGFYLIPPFIILGLLGLACWRLTSMLLSIRKRTAEEIQRRISIEFYLRMERMLAKVGLIRHSAVTPLEFARQSSFMALMLPVVDAFYRVRFGNAVLSEAEATSIQQTLEQLEHSLEHS